MHAEWRLVWVDAIIFIYPPISGGTAKVASLSRPNRGEVVTDKGHQCWRSLVNDHRHITGSDIYGM